MILNQQVLTHSTSGITTYTDARSFVESLANHLKVESTLPSGLSMISVGQNAPDQQYQTVPWLELDENNNPVGLKYYNGTAWVSAAADVAVKSVNSGMYIQQGVFIFDVAGVAGSNENSSSTYTVNGVTGNFQFPLAFNSNVTPVVNITPMDSTIFDHVEAHQDNNFDWRLGAVDRFGFNLDYVFREQNSTDVSSASTKKRFQFSYIAIGQID
jgi:hypothetical protein